MTNTSTALKAILIYAAILPLALLVGYMIATPMDLSSIAVITGLIFFLSVPLMLKWHRAFLLLTWNTTAVVFFLPGRPQLWVLAAALGFVIVVLQKTLIARTSFLHARMVTLPMLILLVVVIATGWVTGGVGLRIFGSQTVGGKAYVWIVAAVLGYCAMISQQIPLPKANLYTALFFLGALTNAVGSLVNLVNPSLYYVFLVFPVDALPSSGQDSRMIPRYMGLSTAAMAAFYYILATCSVREMLSGKKWLKLALLFLMAVVVLGGGYRSYFIPIAVVFCLVFYLEGLVKSRYGLVAVLGCILLIAGLIPILNKLPLPVQRSLSVLPLPVSNDARVEAQLSSEWRINMWKAVVPEIPKYFWVGKGIGINNEELEMIEQNRGRGLLSDFEGAVLTGAYHNGPLTILIPFGIWGLLGWIWFIAASLRALCLNYKHGAPELRQINTLLFALFATKTLVFFAIFGEFRTDFASFLGLVGFGIALNGGIMRAETRVRQVSALRTAHPRSNSPA